MKPLGLDQPHELPVGHAVYDEAPERLLAILTGNEPFPQTS
ncbi:hypothetical protein [Streptomyces sp. 840.1]|nr:hypothetical protein [Streptomyces sp. 840.1]